MTVVRELKGQNAEHSDKKRKEGEDEAAKESELHPKNRCVVCAEDQGVSAARRKVRWSLQAAIDPAVWRALLADRSQSCGMVIAEDSRKNGETGIGDNVGTHSVPWSLWEDYFKLKTLRFNRGRKKPSKSFSFLMESRDFWEMRLLWTPSSGWLLLPGRRPRVNSLSGGILWPRRWKDPLHLNLQLLSQTFLSPICSSRNPFAFP